MRVVRPAKGGVGHVGLSRPRMLGAILAVAVAALASPSSAALAAEPSTVAPSGYIATPAGVTPDTTPEQVASKAKLLQQYLSERSALGADAPTAGAATAERRADGTMSIAAAGQIYSWYGIHQKASNWCLVAVVQSMAYYGLSETYLAASLSPTSTNIKAYQNYIYTKGDPAHGAPALKVCDSHGQCGSDDVKARKWINAQFDAWGRLFFYLNVKPSSQTDFENKIKLDIDVYEIGAYVRVDLTSNKYHWYQGPDPYGKHILHATVATSYDDTNGTNRSVDPFANYKASTGVCSKAWDGGAATWSCWWQMSYANYYAAMDRTAYSKVAGYQPMWY